MSAEAILTLVFAGIVTLSTVVYAALTWQLVRETQRMRSAQTDPSIGLHIEPSSTESQLFMLVIENHGLGPAYDVRFDADAPEDTMERPMAFLRNISGIAYLAPSQKIVSFYGSSIDLLNRPEKGRARVRVTYRRPSGSVRTESFTLDPARFEGMPLVGSNYERKLAKSVEDLAKAFAGIVYGSRLQVTTLTREQQQQEHDVFAERVRAARQARTNPPPASSTDTPPAPDPGDAPV